MFKDQLVKISAMALCSMLMAGQAVAIGPDDNNNSCHASKAPSPIKDFDSLSHEELLALVKRQQNEIEKLTEITQGMSEAEKHLYTLLSTKLTKKVKTAICIRKYAEENEISIESAMDYLEKNPKLMLYIKSKTIGDLLKDDEIDTDIVRDVFRGLINSIDDPETLNLSRFQLVQTPEDKEGCILAKLLSLPNTLIKPLCPVDGVVDKLINHFCKVREAPCIGTIMKRQSIVYWMF